jgi:hypothetical protein
MLLSGSLPRGGWGRVGAVRTVAWLAFAVVLRSGPEITFRYTNIRRQ